MTIKRICALFLLALLAACDIAGQPCGLLNESACSTTPTVAPPTCGAVIPTPGTTLWQCNLPASASDAPDQVNSSPCSLLFCERTSQLEAGVVAEAATFLQSQGFALPGAGQIPIQCKKTGVSTFSHAYDQGPLFSAMQCVQEKPAPCAMFGETCGSLMGAAPPHPLCCKVPEASRTATHASRAIRIRDAARPVSASPRRRAAMASTPTAPMSMSVACKPERRALGRTLAGTRRAALGCVIRSARDGRARCTDNHSPHPTRPSST